MSDWHAIVIDGGEAAVRGFVAGFLGGRAADPSRILVGKDVGVAPETFGERVRALLTGGSHHLVLVPNELVAALADALDRGGAMAGLKLAEHHRVAGASFGFSIETYARDVGTAVHTLLDAPLPGVEVADRSEAWESHPDDQGVELYAPGHPYGYHARGRIRGPIEAVVTTRRRFADIEAVHLEPLHLEPVGRGSS
jgi:hypothetical protein